MSSKQPTKKYDADYMTHIKFFSALFSASVKGKLLFMEELLSLALPAAFYDAFDWSAMVLADRSMFDDAIHKFKSDLLILVEAKDASLNLSLVILLEHKSRFESAFKKQMLNYLFLLSESTGKTVLPVLIYHGRKKDWSGEPEYRSGLEGLPAEIREVLAHHCLNFRYILLNVNEVIEQDLAKGMDIDAALYALANIWHVDMKTVDEVFERSKGVSVEKREALLRPIINYFSAYNENLKEEDIMESERKIMPEGERVMLGVIDKAELRGLEKGLEKGREEGREEVAANMLRADYPVDEICHLIGLSREEVDSIRVSSAGR